MVENMVVLEEGLDPVEIASAMGCCKASFGFLYITW